MIGLEIDLQAHDQAGRIITLTAVAQIFGCVALGWLFFGFVAVPGRWLEALYLGVAVALSSTVIIVKILYDKRELDTLAGRITLGVLVLQDLFVIVFLAIQPDLKHPSFMVFGLAVVKVTLLVGMGYVVSRFALPSIFRFVARQPELVLVGALAWCFALAGFARYLGLSPRDGRADRRGDVSTFPYTLDVIAKVTTLRDFFVTLFFVGLGMSIPTPSWNYAIWMLIVSAFVIVSRLVTVFPVLHWQRLGHRVSLLPAINLCQISELSLVLLALGKAAGDVSENSLSMVAFAFAFLAIDTTYAVGKSDRAAALVLAGARAARVQGPAGSDARDARRRKASRASSCSDSSGRRARCSKRSGASGPTCCPRYASSTSTRWSSRGCASAACR